MYDPELQARFLRSATDAMLEGADVLRAASEAWQAAVQTSLGMPAQRQPQRVEAMPLEPFAAWSWTLDFWRNAGAPIPMSPMPALMSPNAFAWPTAAFASGASWPMFGARAAAPMMPMMSPMMSMSPTNDPSAFMAAMVKAYWTLPAITWSLYRGPMTLALVNAGMPYAIAAPTARASAAALDAADAMRMQTIKSFASYHSESGHASSQLFAPPPSRTRH